MSLDVYISNAAESKQSSHSDPIAQLSQAFLYEAQQELTGLAQLADRTNKVELVLAPEQPATQAQEHAQMIGRAAADLVPMLVTSLAVRFGLGRVLGHGAPTEAALAQRPLMGLTLAETGVTGFLTGSLLKPSDEQAKDSMPGFLWDRTKGGIGGALSFSALAGINSATVCASEKIPWSLGRKIATNPLTTALLAGAPAGLANAEINSLVNNGQFTTSGAEIGKSIYEMTFLGTAFAGIGMAMHHGSIEQTKETSAHGAQPDRGTGIPHSAKNVLTHQDVIAADALKSGAEVTSSDRFEVETPSSISFGGILPSPFGSHMHQLLSHSLDDIPHHNHSVFSYEHGSIFSPFASKSAHDQLDPQLRQQLPELLANATRSGAQLQHSPGADASAQSLTASEGLRSALEQPESREVLAIAKGAQAAELDSEDLERSATRAGKPDSAVISQAKLIEQLPAKLVEAQPEQASAPLISPQELYAIAQGWAPRPSDAQVATRREALVGLAKHFEEEPKLVEFLKKNFVPYASELLAFIDEAPQTRKALALSEVKRFPAAVSVGNLRALDSLLNTFGADSPAGQKLLHSSHRRGLTALAEFIKEEPQERTKQVQALLESDADWYQIDGKLLSSLEVLKEKLGEDSDAMRQILSLHGDRVRELRDGTELAEHEVFPDSELNETDWDEEDSHAWLEDEGWLDSTETVEEQAENRPLPSLSKTSVIELADFLREGGEERVELIERLLSQERYRAFANRLHLETVETIEAAFGADSPTTQRLLSMADKDPDLDLIALSDGIRRDPAAARILERMISDGASGQQLEPDHIYALTRLEKLYGSGSATTERLFQLAKEELAPTSLVRYIDQTDRYFEGSSKGAQAPQKETERRSALVKTLVDSGTPPQLLDGDRLTAFDQLAKQLGAQSPLLKKLVESESEKGLRLEEINRALMSAQFDSRIGSVRPELLDAVVSHGSNLKTLDAVRIVGLQGSVDLLGQEHLPALLKLQEQRLDLYDLTMFAIGNKERRLPKLKTMLEGAATPDQLDTHRLSALEQLENRYGEGSPVLEKLLSLENDKRFIVNMGALSQNDATAHTIQKLIESGASPVELAPERVLGLSQLEQVYGEESPALHRFLDMEKQGASLIGIANFLNLSLRNSSPSESNRALLDKWIDENTPPDRFNFGYLSSLKNFTDRFGPDSPTLARIVELERQGLNLKGLREFIDEDPEKHKLLVETLINNDATASELSYDRLQAISIFINKLGTDKPVFDHLFKLEKEGLSLPALANYITDDEKAHVAQIKKLLTDQAPLKDINPKKLADASMLERLNKHFADDPDAGTTMRRISEMQKEGLSASRLLRYIDENRQVRSELVGRLVKENASIEQLNDHMRLSVFTEPVAEKLVAASRRDGMNLAQILGALRDWHSGIYFRDLVQEHVESGRALSAKAMLPLQQQAKDAAKHAAQDSYGSEPQAVTYSRAVPARAAELARILQEAKVKIDETIPKDKPVVLLGRDNWPLYPLLKAQGRNVQYFLWSRLHEVDDPTARQWLKEVPHGAAVIDTGYHGSIIDAVRRIDPSAKGYLLSSSGHYPQLLRDTDHSSMVGALEYFPKLIGRSKSYTEKGGAISRNDTRDGDEAGTGKMDRHHRWLVQGATRDLLRAMNLPDWYVWRFSEYTGLTPRERIGVNTQAELDAHYRRVRESRGGN